MVASICSLPLSKSHMDSTRRAFRMERIQHRRYSDTNCSKPCKYAVGWHPLSFDGRRSGLHYEFALIVLKMSQGALVKARPSQASQVCALSPANKPTSTTGPLFSCHQQVSCCPSRFRMIFSNRRCYLVCRQSVFLTHECS